jgi:hypothetical protein
VYILNSAAALSVALLAAGSAHAQLWASGRGTGTSSGSGSIVDVNVDTGEVVFSEGVPYNQFRAATITFGPTGGAGSTGGGVIPSAFGSGALSLITNLDINAGVETLSPGVTALKISALGQTTFVSSIPITFYPFPARRELRGSSSSAALLDQLRILVTGTDPVLFELRATGDLTPLLSTATLTPASPGAAVIGNTLRPGVYELPRISVGVNQSSFPVQVRPTFDGTFSVVLGVPAPGTGVALAAGLVCLGRRRRSGSAAG